MLLAMVGIFPHPADNVPVSDPPPAAPADPAPPPDLPPEPEAPPVAAPPVAAPPVAAPPLPALPVAEPPVAAPAVGAPAVAPPPVAAPAVGAPPVAAPAPPPPLLPPPVAEAPPEPWGVLPAEPGVPFVSSVAEQPPSEDAMVIERAMATECVCFMRISSKGMVTYYCQHRSEIVVTPCRKNFRRWLFYGTVDARCQSSAVQCGLLGGVARRRRRAHADVASD